MGEKKKRLKKGVFLIKNVLKIVFLGVVGFSLLVYLTAPKNPNKEVEVKEELNIKDIPTNFSIISGEKFSLNSFSQLKKDKFIVVLNHDALGVFNHLYKFSSKDIILVANISNTPWIIKQLAVNDKLNELFKDSTIPLIVDEKGFFANKLNIKNGTQNSYFVYNVDSNGRLNYLFEDKVKLNSLQNEEDFESIKKDINSFLIKF